MKVLVLAVRGLQTAYVGCYGNPWIATPALDALAAGGVVFDRHYSGLADAAGARRTWRDGRHHLPDPSRPESPDDGRPDLIELLRKRGVVTCLILDDSRPAESGFEAGWDEVHCAVSFDAVLEAASSALDRLATRGDWLLWVDLAALIPPWETPEEFLAPYFQAESSDEEEEEEEVLEPLTPLNDPAAGAVDAEDDELFLRLQDSYAGAVTWLDDGIGRLLERLATLDAGDDTLVVLTADCGLALGEHGHVGPAKSAHPRGGDAPAADPMSAGDRRGGAARGGADAGGGPGADAGRRVRGGMPSAQGRTLLPLVYGEVEEVHAYVCSGGAGRGHSGVGFTDPGMGFSAAGGGGRGRRGCTSSQTTVGK